MKLPDNLKPILVALHNAGGFPYVVGGAVRDFILGVEPKDFDVEVFGLDFEKVKSVVSHFEKVEVVGKAFGVLRAGDFEFSLPRRENCVGRHHRDFEVTFDPHMSHYDATSRRDFTVNAIMFDPIGDKIVDPQNGQKDLSNKILRHVNPVTFIEDPLRVLRGFQMCARFGLSPIHTTIALCRAISYAFGSLSQERVYDEWMKWATKGKKLSLGLNFLRETGWIDHFPQLKAIIGVQQNPEYHPEGDVWVHTCHVVDVASELADLDDLDGERRAARVFAALCHDFGKPICTELKDGKLVSPGHGMDGVPLAEAFLDGIMIPRKITDSILPLIRDHLTWVDTPGKRSVRRLAKRLEPSNLVEFSRLVEADQFGRPPLPRVTPKNVLRILEIGKDLKVTKKGPDKILTGKVLLAHELYKPGPAMGKILSIAYDAQLDGAFDDVDGALQWLEQSWMSFLFERKRP